jgi:Fe-S cluster biosynthesis and repair protein YggX
MAQRTVHCRKLDKDAPGLDSPPFEGELGQQIFENISQEAWNSWSGDLMIKVINEYRLNLADKEHYQVLLEQMKAYLQLDDSASVLEVDNPERGQ